MNLYSLYQIATGELTGARISATGPLDPAWLPDGCGAILGEWDHQLWTVDHATGACTARPAAPPDWQILKYQAAEAAMSALLQAEAAQARPMREIVEALVAGAAPPAASTARFAEIKTQIDAARTRYAAILAAQTPDQLNAL